MRNHGWPARFAFVLWQIVYVIVYVCVSALIWNCNCITFRHNITITICVKMCSRMMLQIFAHVASMRNHGRPALFAFVLWHIVYVIVYVCVSDLIWNCNCITFRHRVAIRFLLKCVAGWCCRYSFMWRQCGITGGPLVSRLYYDRSFMWLCTCVCLLWSGIVIVLQSVIILVR